jgi:hypothetical protein
MRCIHYCGDLVGDVDSVRSPNKVVLSAIGVIQQAAIERQQSVWSRPSIAIAQLLQ